jgi:hypothetical protein
MTRLKTRVGLAASAILAVAASLLAGAPAAHATVTQAAGATAPGTTSTKPDVNYRSATTYQATASGTSTTFRFYARGGTADEKFTAHVYATNSSGQPTDKLGTSSEVTVHAGQAAGWVSAALPGVAITAGTKYALAVAWGPTTQGAYVYYTPSTGAGFWQQTSYPAATSTWGTIGVNDQKWAFALDVNNSASDDDGTQAAVVHGWGSVVAGDEFNGTSVDTSKWGLYNGPGHAGNGRRLPQQITEGNGYLTITGLPNGDSGGMDWNNGQMYGRWEARMRVNQVDTGGHPYHPVLILWPDSEDWPDGGEYDYAESNAGSTTMNAFLHYGDGTSDGAQEGFSTTVDLTQWHNYAIEWTSGHITGYLDGQQWFTTSDSFVQAPGPMHETIQLDDFFPDGGLNQATMDVNWLRMYDV